MKFEIIPTKAILYDKCENVEQLYDNFYYPLLVEYKELKKKYENAVADYEKTRFEKEQLNSLVNSCQKEIRQLKKQLDYLRSEEYYNQLRFERDMLQNVVDNGEVPKEDKQFIDMTHRNTELLEQQKEFINYLEDEIKLQEEINDIVLATGFEEILQNYKEIIGDVKNEKENIKEISKRFKFKEILDKSVNDMKLTNLYYSKEFVDDIISKLKEKDKEIERLNNIINKGIEAINVYQNEKTLSIGYQDLKRIRGILRGNEFDLKIFEEYLQELKGVDKE